MNNVLDPEMTRDEMKLVHHLYKHAAQILSEDGYLLPVVHFRAGLAPQIAGMQAGELATLVIEMPSSDAGKDYVAGMLRDVARKTDADMVVLLFESWMIKPDSEEMEFFQRHREFQVRPSAHPKRIEIILLSVSKPGGQQWSAWVEIQRDARGNPLIPAYPPPLEFVEATGRFSNLFAEDDYHPSKS
jgi:hypothetical protein